MDKETLSHYGWIVVVVIIIAILLGCSASFAAAIKNNFIGITNRFTNEAVEAFDAIEDNTTPENDTPPINEFGFYYNVPYAWGDLDDPSGYSIFTDKGVEEFYAESDEGFFYYGEFQYTYSNNTIDEPSTGYTYTISNNGQTLTAQDGVVLTLTDERYAGIVWEAEYIGVDDNSNSIIFIAFSDGSATLSINGTVTNMAPGTYNWNNTFHYEDDAYLLVTMDGTKIVVDGYVLSMQ